MKHRDGSSESVAGDDERGSGAVEPDFARENLNRDGRLAEVGEVEEPNFATTDIDPAEPDPIPAGTPNFATTDIDPDEADPIDPDRPNFATKDQQLP
jgi:hypothetical protein